ncbi:MAG: hypothetical protein IKO93_19865, partial [Lentisphaeria bacterium]|nr:hypothetical protein [Lentisphaeria bacterium]
MLLTLLVCGIISAGETKLKVVEVTEEVGATPGLPRGKLDRLIDGKKNLFVFWPTWNVKRQPHIDLFLRLRGPADISRVEIGVFRRGVVEEYDLARMELYVQDASGKFIPAAMDAAPQKISGARGTLTLPVKGVKGEYFKLRLAGVKYVAVTEISFFGQEDPAVSSVVNLPNYYAAKTSKTDQLTLRKIRFNDLRGIEYVVENARMLWVITPKIGGMLNYALDKKSGKNFIKSRSRKEWGGAFGDKYQLGSIPQQLRLYNAQYQVKIIEQTDDLLVLRLSINAENSLPGPVFFSRDYIFRKDSAALEIRHRISNDSRNVVPYDQPFVYHSYLGGKQPVKRFFFKNNGPVLNDCGSSLDVTDTVNACGGVLDEKGDGLAILVDFMNTAILRFWSDSPNNTTVEAVQGSRPVPADKAIETTVYFVPFHGIQTPHAVFPEGAVELILTGKKLNLKFIPSGTALPRISASYVEGKPICNSKLVRKDILLTEQYNGQAVEIELSFAGGQKRKLYYRGDSDFKIPAELRNVRPLPAGSPSYGEIDLNFNSTAVIPDDGPAPKPLKNVPEILIAGHGFYWCREAVDMAWRNGLRIRTLPVGKIFRIGNNQQEISYANTGKMLNETLTKEKFHVLAVMGNLWNKMSEPQRKTVMNRVREGAGLILICPGPPSVKTAVKGQMTPAVADPILSGVPFSLLPEIPVFATEAAGETCL